MPPQLTTKLAMKPLRPGVGDRRLSTENNRTISKPSRATRAPVSPSKGVLRAGEAGSPNACRPHPPRQTRASLAIRLAAAAGLRDAVLFACQADMPLNRFVTIHWDAAAVADDQAATARYLKLAGDWVRVRGGVFAFIWVRESGEQKGRHVHILMHLPPNLTLGFNRRQRGWLKACGAAWRAKVILTRPIGRSLQHALSGGADYQTNLLELLDYVLKGADQAARAVLGIVRQKDGGLIQGKRCGFSQNLGPRARQRAESSGSRT